MKRIAWLLAFVFVLSGCRTAPQLTPDQAKFVLETALPTLKNEHQITRQVIEAIQ